MPSTPAAAKLLSFFLLACGAVAAAQAQPQQNPNIKDIEAAGYVILDGFTTPLLHHMRTGAPYNLAALLDKGHDRLPSDMKKLSRQYGVLARDEFDRREARGPLEGYISQQVERMRGARGYLFELRSQLSEYDFKHNRFPLKLTMLITAGKTGASYHCTGAHDRVKDHYSTACVAAPNLASSDPVFRFLPMADAEMARQIKRRYGNRELVFFAVAEPQGRYNPVKYGRMAYGGFLDRIYITGVQPARITGVILLDNRSGEILWSGEAARGATAPTVREREQQDVVAAPAGAAPPVAAGPALAPPAGPAPVASAPPPSAGVGADPVRPAPGPTTGLAGPHEPGVAPGPLLPEPEPKRTQLLAALSYLVYTSPEQVREARTALADVRAKYQRIADDSGRHASIQARELQKLNEKIESRELVLEELEEMEVLKANLAAEYGLQRIRDSLLPKGVYYERYRLPDGYHVIVFRGTETLDDLRTDGQLVYSPEAVDAIARKLKQAGGKYVYSGLSKVKTSPAAQRMPDPAVGRPPAFLAADQLVRLAIRQGQEPSRLILTGHSLGGGLAQYSGFMNRVAEVVTFNTAPLSAPLRSDVTARIGEPGGRIQHYISYLPDSAGATMHVDPVSQAGLADMLDLPATAALKVMGGQKRLVAVCPDLESDEYEKFSARVQRSVTTGTVMALGAGRGGLKNLATAAGATTGVATAQTDVVSAGTTGALRGRSLVTRMSAGLNCIKHPYLCSAGAAAGGLASVGARATTPKIWAIINVHRMKYLYEALQLGDSGCHASAFQEPDPMPAG